MLNCLHLLNAYLGKSEVFIWNILSSYNRFKPWVLAESHENLEQFILPGGRLLECRSSRVFLPSFIARLRGDFAQSDYSACLPEIEHQPLDILHAHYGYRGLVSLDLKKRLNIPMVTSFYGFDLSQKRFLRRAAKGYQRLFSEGEAFMVEGPAMRERLFKLGCPWDKIHLVPIGIYPDHFPFTRREWDGTRKIKFLFVGRFCEKKGLLQALEAFSRLKGAFPWSLSVVGDGPLRKAVEYFIKDHGLGGNVTLAGMVDLSKLVEFYSTHDILIQPSLTARDGDSEGGAPTVLLEAQACGMPVISTWHDDIPNVVREGRSALLSTEGSVDELHRNILKMAECKDQWGGMSEAGRANILEHHNIIREIVKIEKKYFSLLS